MNQFSIVDNLRDGVLIQIAYLVKFAISGCTRLTRSLLRITIDLPANNDRVIAAIKELLG